MHKHTSAPWQWVKDNTAGMGWEIRGRYATVARVYAAQREIIMDPQQQVTELADLLRIMATADYPYCKGTEDFCADDWRKAKMDYIEATIDALKECGLEYSSIGDAIRRLPK